MAAEFGRPLQGAERPVKRRQDMSARDVADLHDRLSRKLGDTSLPTLPEVALRIMDLVAREDATIDQFAEVIQSDQALTGRLLRLANSAHYAQAKPVTTLNRTMVLIGMDRLKAMALGFPSPHGGGGARLRIRLQAPVDPLVVPGLARPAPGRAVR